MLRGLEQILVHMRRPHRDWARPAFECLSAFCGGMGQQWPATEAGALGTANLGVSSSCHGSMGFLTRYDEDLREPLVQCQVSQVSMRVKRWRPCRVPGTLRM